MAISSKNKAHHAQAADHALQGVSSARAAALLATQPVPWGVCRAQALFSAGLGRRLRARCALSAFTATRTV